eukprot:COSAG03_NODE_11574_length_586_cov_0.794661_1_plen_67_part_10
MAAESVSYLGPKQTRQTKDGSIQAVLTEVAQQRRPQRFNTVSPDLPILKLYIQRHLRGNENARGQLP